MHQDPFENPVVAKKYLVGKIIGRGSSSDIHEGVEHKICV